MRNSIMKPTRLLPLAALIGAAFAPHALAADEAAANETQAAAETTVEVKQINVKGRRTSLPAVERKNAEQLKEELINDNKDLVRYSPDVGVADQGRHSKGFAIRGVEDNRVGISIDGVALPDSEENSLYKRYGNLNTSRQSIDTELARSVEVVKGADSFNQGSGNLGGGVNYRTLEPGDIVTGESPFGAMLRTGYASKNREWFQTIGSAYQGEKADAVLLFSNRHGHETKSAGGFTVPEDSLYTRTRRNSRQIPDPAEHNNKSYLAKYAYRFSPEHRAGISYSGQRGHNHIIEDSATTLTTSWREAEDSFDRKTANAFYEYTPDSTWLSMLKADVDYQRADTWAVNDEGSRAGVTWSGYKEREPSDRNTRIFKTDLTRFNLRMDTQPLALGKTDHSLSLKAAVSEKNFDVLHKDSFYLSGEWQHQPDSTMMHPIETRQYYFSLNDKIRFNDTFSGYAGLRYDHAKHAQQDLNGLSCNNCVKAADSKFKQFTWAAGFDAKLSQSWQAGYTIGTGFRIPNASEMYFDYRNNRSGAWISNPNLKAERSLTQGLNLRGNGSYGQLSIGLHHTGYKDFLYEQETWEEYTDYGITSFRPVQQMQNIDSAKIYGIEATGRLNLDRITPLPQGWKLFGSVGLSKGSMANGADLLSLQPLKAIIGLDYEDPEGKYGVFSRLTYMAGKKAKDAKYQKATETCVREESTYDWWDNTYTTTCAEYSHNTELQTWPHLNKKAVVFDLFGYYKPSKNFTVRAGVYNLFNRKYHTWDTLRGLNITGGIVNSVGVRENTTYGGYPGLQRYYNPGRNYTVSLEWKF